MGTTESTLETLPSDSAEAWQYITKDAETVLKINGKTYKVSPKLDPQTTLNTFIRDHTHLRGTKYMCYEGGCGSCVVTAKSKHPFKMKEEVYAVNSCLIPVFVCNGWEITTVEGIGNRKKGYNSIQTQLAKKNGSQCGYCSPGMVMNMYSLLEGKEKVTMQEVEDSFGGNTCRCTGYRPILDAFKSLATDASSDLKEELQDIEELGSTKMCPRTGQKCLENIEACANQIALPFLASRGVWYHPKSIPEIFNIFNTIGNKSYMLVGGNTAHGVYRTGPSDVYINIGNVPELKAVTPEPNLILGGNLSLNETKDLFNKLSSGIEGYAYLKVLADHLDLVANVPVRNAGTLAGNLFLKHQHRDFPSDVFLMLETVGATLEIDESGDRTTKVNMMDFLDMDMNKKVIRSISLPKIDGSYSVRTIKIMPVAQNSRAIVNAGFNFKINKSEKGKVLTKPRILFGGINPDFVHASKTESYLNGKNLFDLSTLQAALKVLDGELRPDYVLPDATPAYRKGLAEALFYKFVLGLSPPGVSKRLLSGGKNLERPLSSGKQDYGTDKSVWPLNQPVTKLEALVQCSGEAEYVNDIPAIPGEVYAAFVLTTEGQGKISSVDTSEALAMPGVITYVDVKDVPGKNSFIKPGLPLLEAEEEIFCSGNIKYNGQSVGLIVADTRQTAIDAAQKVKIKYTDVKKPVIYIRDALKDESRVRVEQKAKDVTIPEDPAHVIKGSLNYASQYHYQMELQTAVCVPIEDGMDIYPASQWMDLNQVCIAEALESKEKNINVRVRRLGGAYGSKISRATLISCAGAVAAYKLNKPVRLTMTMEVNTGALGKRGTVAVDYEVYLDKDAKITCLKAEVAEEAGCSYNEPVSPLAIDAFQNCYNNNNWGITGKAVLTDLPSMTYCRAPGSAEGIASIEFIMEHIAKVVKKDPYDVRMSNMLTENNAIPQLMKSFKETADYEPRKNNINDFNKNNRWRKRGMAMVPMRYPLQILGVFHAMVVIYAQDGTVAVVHGGIEMGQGINTKAAQVAGHELGIPLEYISVKPSTVLTSPNDFFTAGSITSETVAYAVMMCCKELLKRMEPVKKTLNDPTWQEWVLACYQNSVDLSASYMFSTKDNVKDYFIYGVTIAEIELDVLTGQHQIIRVDILEDAGRSLSPEIDVGQVEGAFTMGLGYWLLEYVVYNPENGQLLTNRSWNYKVPGAKDIPIDLRVYLRRNAPNPLGVLRSKATGEPPLCMTCCLPIAMRYAINEARKEAGLPDEWYPMDYPTTTERAFIYSTTNINLFTI